ncbi:MAG: CtsR family transcriptional regulator [Eubacteriales bacterium]
MSILSDSIEQFIKTMMKDYEGEVEIQRNELASYFNCAPSQINYVLATRFNLDQGYIIESKRGGGGCIRVFKIEANDDYLLNLITVRIADEISKREANALIDGLQNAKSIDQEEVDIMKAAVSDKALNIPVMVKDKVRASILKQMIIAIMKQGE